jgi:hypothetical protein
LSLVLCNPSNNNKAFAPSKPRSKIKDDVPGRHLVWQCGMPLQLFLLQVLSYSWLWVAISWDPPLSWKAARCAVCSNASCCLKE